MGFRRDAEAAMGQWRARSRVGHASRLLWLPRAAEGLNADSDENGRSAGGQAPVGRIAVAESDKGRDLSTLAERRVVSRDRGERRLEAAHPVTHGAVAVLDGRDRSDDVLRRVVLARRDRQARRVVLLPMRESPQGDQQQK